MYIDTTNWCHWQTNAAFTGYSGTEKISVFKYIKTHMLNCNLDQM